MEHSYLKHINCTEPHCNICEGGLAYCTTCKGGEVQLPTDCPGIEMSKQQMEDVSAGKIDFRHGDWVGIQ